MAALTTHSNVCCFLYPAYASYKALSIRPESSEEANEQVKRWLMYWAVIGSWTAVEMVVGWTFTWCVQSCFALGWPYMGSKWQ